MSASARPRERSHAGAAPLNGCMQRQVSVLIVLSRLAEFLSRFLGVIGITDVSFGARHAGPPDQRFPKGEYETSVEENIARSFGHCSCFQRGYRASGARRNGFASPTRAANACSRRYQDEPSRQGQTLTDAASATSAKADRVLLATVLRAIVRDKSLSVMAHKIKILAEGGCCKPAGLTAER